MVIGFKHATFTQEFARKRQAIGGYVLLEQRTGIPRWNWRQVETGRGVEYLKVAGMCYYLGINLADYVVEEDGVREEQPGLFTSRTLSGTTLAGDKK